MFDIGWSELVIVGVVALLVIGPKELPGVLRMVGQWMGKVRRMAADFQGQFQEAMREAEMADLKKQVDDIADSTRDFTSDFDPMRSMEDTFDDPMTEKAKPEGSKIAETDASASTEEADLSALPHVEPAAAEPSPAASAESKPSADAASDDAPPPRAAAGGGAA